MSKPLIVEFGDITQIGSGVGIELPELSTKPSNPSSGFWKIYPKSDGNLYLLDSNGVETIISGGGVTVPSAPPSGTSNSTVYLRGLLGSSGLDSGITNQNVDGSVTPSIFYVGSNNDYDYVIQKIRVIIADSQISNKKFGNIDPLINGWDLKLTENSETNFIIQSGSTFGTSLIQSGGRYFETLNYSGNSDAYGFDILLNAEDKADGLRIGRGNMDKLESIVNDNLTTLELFQVYVFGYKNIPQS